MPASSNSNKRRSNSACQTQGTRCIFTASESCSLLSKHVITTRISLNEANLLHPQENPQIYIECNSFEKYNKSSLVAFSTSKDKKTNTKNNWHLGAVLCLHPEKVVIARIKLNTDNYFAESTHSFNIINGDYVEVIYLNIVSPSSIAEDGFISSSSDGPSCINISNFSSISVPDISKLPKIFQIQECKFSDRNFPFPRLVFNTHHKTRKSSLAHPNMKQIYCTDNHISKPKGLLFPGIPSTKYQPDGSKVHFYNFNKDLEKRILRKLNSRSGLSLYEYQKYISFSSNECYTTRLHTPSNAGDLYTTSSSDRYEVTSLKEPKEVYETDEDVLMQTIKVDGGTFKINEDLFVFIIDHVLKDFNFARSCQSSSLGTNFYYGKNQAAYVRPTPNKSKEEIYSHCLWRQSFNPLFAPLLMKYLNIISQQSTKYDAAFDQVGDTLQTKIFQQLGLRLDKWKLAALTILTKNFANQAHFDKNDIFGDEFLAIARSLVDECRDILTIEQKPKRNSHSFGLKHASKKNVYRNKLAVNTHLSNLLRSVEDCSRPTCCGYKVLGKLDQQEELLATFTNLSCGISINIVNDIYLRFFGAKSLHLTTVPLVINWENNTIRLINVTSLTILAWGIGRSARRRFLEVVSNT